MSKIKGIDMKPRRVWFGISILGKKMTAMLEPYLGLQRMTDRGRFLLDLYKDAPYKALLYAAVCLHILPEQGTQFGPAFRDFTKGATLTSGVPGLYGAILTDMRDFLKFRFRVTVLPDSLGISNEAILETLRTGRFPPDIQATDPEQVIRYAIQALDSLSRQQAGVIDIRGSIENLRDLLRRTAETVMEPWEKKTWNEVFANIKS